MFNIFFLLTFTFGSDEIKNETINKCILLFFSKYNQPKKKENFIENFMEI